MKTGRTFLSAIILIALLAAIGSFFRWGAEEPRDMTVPPKKEKSEEKTSEVIPLCLENQLLFKNEVSCVCEGIAEQTERGLMCLGPKG